MNLGSFERDLRARVRGEIAFDEVTRGIYSTDASIYQIQPVGVVCPLDEEDVRAAIRTANEHEVPILPRGAGTSLAGQTVGAALVLDFSRHLNKVLEVNVEERWARVQPGVVRDELNAILAKDRLHFAPDPATADRANFGGMIANNSSGTRSIIYGKTVDHVLELRILLADGSEMSFSALSPDEYTRQAHEPTRAGEIHRRVREVVDSNREEIEARYPKVMRRVMGYNLDEFTKTERWNLSKLVVGSEGTLATILEAKVNLEPLPNATSVVVVHFEELLAAIRAVESIVAHGPSMVEILDKTVLDMARENLSIAPLCDFVEGHPAAVLFVEFYGDTQEQANSRTEKLIADLAARGVGYTYPVRNDPAGKGRIMTVRKNGLGLMLGIKGDRKPIPFIEDSAIPLPHLAEYIDRVLKFCAGLDVPVAMYAHASVGLIHVRPILDLRTRQDIEFMKTISRRAFEMVKEYGGAFCGEHGDGMNRSPYMEEFYGPRIYAAFKEIKHLFDPKGLMNPGKIIDAGPMDRNLRYGTEYRLEPFPTVYKYREDASFSASVEMCTGVGACRNRLAGTMCPSYRATGDEEHSTRGRANALRLAMTGQLGEAGMTSGRLHETLDLCLSCKGCKSECPSNVDMAKLKSEFLQHYHDHHGLSMRERMVAASADMAPISSGLLAPFVNWLQETSLFKGMLESWIGFDSRRTLPRYSARPFHKSFRSSHHGSGNGKRRVVLFDDTYLNYFEPNIGRAAVELLESCGYEVLLARAGCCQRPRISHGLLREAKHEGTNTLRALDVHLCAGVPVVVCEPSCASALVDDLPDLIEDEDLAARARNGIKMIDVFLAEELAHGNIRTKFNSPARKILIHGHCHQKALFGTTAMKSLLARVDGLSVTEVDSGCCGMAGSFGYEKEHHDLSLKIGEDRLFPAVRKTDSETTVVACGFSCRHQLADATGIRAVHWVETVRGVGSGA
ncbi:MAG: hypothetical protein GHCLOJNM_01487 [bacterium]|nr:hypothetical protein [bacterium]